MSGYRRFAKNRIEEKDTSDADNHVFLYAAHVQMLENPDQYSTHQPNNKSLEQLVKLNCMLDQVDIFLIRRRLGKFDRTSELFGSHGNLPRNCDEIR